MTEAAFFRLSPNRTYTHPFPLALQLKEILVPVTVEVKAMVGTMLFPVKHNSLQPHAELDSKGG